MWNRLLQPVSCMIAMFLLLGCATGVAHAAQIPDTRPSDTTPGLFSSFAGTWVAHGAQMVIANDGSAQFEARTYIWCAPRVPQPCDALENNRIIAGYHEQLALSRIADSMAYGAVLASNNPLDKPDASITLTLGVNDTLIYTNHGIITILCGPTAPVNTCGA